MAYNPIVAGVFVAELTSLKPIGGRKRWRDRRGNLYEWDSRHGELEGTNDQGVMVGGATMRLLDDLEKGLIATDDPDALTESIEERWHAGEIQGDLMDVLGLAPEEYTAWASFGADFRLLLEWRRHGRPSTCGLCGNPIGQEHWAVFDKDNGVQVRTHFSCWADASGRRKADEHLVARFLKRQGLSTEFSPERHASGLTTPEYLILKNGATVGVCEVKTVPAFGGSSGGSTAFADLRDNLGVAATQFNLVNPSRELVNILGLVDHRSGLMWADLYSLIRESIAAETRTGYQCREDMSLGQVRADQWPVDVYLWLASKRGPARGPGRFGVRFSFKMIFNSSDPGRFLHACALFGVDAAAVPTLD